MTEKQTVRILCLPGVGTATSKKGGNWLDQWQGRLHESLIIRDKHPVELEFYPVDYQSYFDQVHPASGGQEEDIEFAEAVVRMGWRHLDRTLGKLFRREAGLDPLVEALYWHAGVVAYWTRDEKLRTRLRKRIRTAVTKHRPHVVLAHSVGSLIAYDAFARSEDLIYGRYFVTFGSQLGNPQVRTVFGGRLIGLPTAKRWFHLYNSHDAVFTTALRLPAENFVQVNTYFDNPDPLDHMAVSTGEGTIGYLDHLATRQLVWPQLLDQQTSHVIKSLKAVRKQITESPDHRALLVGVDRYGHPAVPPLSGCVNDTFIFSEMLQRNGFPREQIRLLHNERATTSAIRDRLEWLLDDVDADDEEDDSELRILFFSGHGAQLENYGIQEIADRQDECLCPYDFDWSIDHAILDDHIYDLYSQLPYKARFLMVFDCCHSGGMSRSGANVRGLSNPLDVAHRGIYFTEQNGAWRWSRREGSHWKRPSSEEMARHEGKPSKFVPFHLDFGVGEVDDERRSLWFGRYQSTRKIGRAASIREMPDKQFNKVRRVLQHKGPYLPVIIEACREDEPALEHTEGAVTYGAFTFSLLQALEQLGGPRTDIPYDRLLEETINQMRALGYAQTPQLLRPPEHVHFPKFSGKRSTS